MSMTESEALAELKTFPVNCLDFKENQALQIAVDLLEQYRAIGTVSEFRELKEKATPKNPIVEVYAQSLYERKTYRCPSCNHKLISKIDGGWCGGTLSKNCEKCGSAIDWSEGKE